jgi:carbon monoxide dehydrogenase subunit G
MASVTRETLIAARPEDVWAALQDFQAVHQRLAAGFVVDSRPDGEGARVVIFFNGAVAREILVAVDDADRRLVYSVVESALGFTHHNAAARVDPAGADGDATRFVWTVDLLPDDAAAYVAPLMEQGLEAIRTTLEATADPTPTTAPATAAPAPDPALDPSH